MKRVIIGYTPDDGDFWVEYYLGEGTDNYEDRINIYSGNNNESMPLTLAAGESVRVKVYSWSYAQGNQNANDPYEHSIQIRIVHENNL